MPSYRPVFHFSPARGWMNDPNGLVWHNGRWHLCYQHAPDHVCWDPGMHWGHAVSRDLTHWEHWPIALYPDELGSIFSGSAALREERELVACFTHAHERGQTQSLAFSQDEGKTWKKYERNPVLTSDRRDFRDPKIFCYGSEWRMVLAAGLDAQIYASSNLTEWKLLSAFPSPIRDCTWECPDLIEIDGQWILMGSLILPNSLPKEGNNTRFWLGDFDGVAFTARSGPHALSLGPDDYAAVSWSNAPERRTVIIGWMSHWTYANQTPTQDEGWRGAMTMPRVLSLSNGVLTQRPPEEFLKMRGQPSLITEDFSFNARAFEIELELDLTQLRAAETGIRFWNDAGEFLQIIYNQETGEIRIDRTQSRNVAFHPDFAGVFRSPLPFQDRRLKLNIFVDHCSIELFAQEGLLYGAALVFPTAAWHKLDLIGDGTAITHGAFYP
ncbi:MAG: glycoside hydrolase family 32 protein, partial [Terrimicrobiaceae bacterium]